MEKDGAFFRRKTEVNGDFYSRDFDEDRREKRVKQYETGKCIKMKPGNTDCISRRPRKNESWRGKKKMLDWQDRKQTTGG